MEDTPSSLGKVSLGKAERCMKLKCPVIKIEFYLRVCISYPTSASLLDALSPLPSENLVRVMVKVMMESRNNLSSFFRVSESIHPELDIIISLPNKQRQSPARLPH